MLFVPAKKKHKSLKPIVVGKYGRHSHFPNKNLVHTTDIIFFTQLFITIRSIGNSAPVVLPTRVNKLLTFPARVFCDAVTFWLLPIADTSLAETFRLWSRVHYNTVTVITRSICGDFSYFSRNKYDSLRNRSAFRAPDGNAHKQSEIPNTS